MNSGDNLEGKIKEMVACDHLPVVWQPLINQSAPHAYLRGELYIVVEEQKVKLVCPYCFRKAVLPSLYV